MSDIVVREVIENKIYWIRGFKVMLDRDLASLYGISTRRLNEQVRRNAKRFPEDFMIQLSKKELKDWMSQFATSNSEKMGIRKPPLAFTELGIAMLSSILNSERAIRVNIQIMRIFTKLREILNTHEELQLKIEQILRTHGGRLDVLDSKIKVIFELLDQLLKPPGDNEKKRYGFLADRA